ncbi:MAG: S-methyl-5-thioribose-1-phosphate isomerase [Polyangiaceae bacterium]
MTSSKGKSGVALPTLRTGQANPHPEPIGGPRSPVELMPSFRVVLLDQRRLPRHERYDLYGRVEEVSEAIRAMVVRGAPAIGVAAAYGVVLAAAQEKGDELAFHAAIRAADRVLRVARPTAVNLGWALDHMAQFATTVAGLDYGLRTARMAEEARRLHTAEVSACRRIGELSLEHIPDDATILTHCNAGALATGGYGTALGVVRAAHTAGKRVRVLACETRPYLQGARLTAWELSTDGIPVEVICDSMVAHFMSKGEITCVVVGADRIARNGDVANKIGTYGVACLAKAHGVPFFVAAPWSTVDMKCPDGAAIPIEQRDEREVTHFTTSDGTVDVQLVPDGVRARHPAFDVTPAGHVQAIFTERGVVAPPAEAALYAMAGPLLP